MCEPDHCDLNSKSVKEIEKSNELAIDFPFIPLNITLIHLSYEQEAKYWVVLLHNISFIPYPPKNSNFENL